MYECFTLFSHSYFGIKLVRFLDTVVFMGQYKLFVQVKHYFVVVVLYLFVLLFLLHCRLIN